jgi:hypothetical protein
MSEDTSPTWHLNAWKGAPDVIEAAVRALGWYGQGEALGLAQDPRVGGFLREKGRPPLPDGAEVLGRDHTLALIGTF